MSENKENISEKEQQENTIPENESVVEENIQPDSTTQENNEEENFKEKYLRLYAEFDNYRKRTAKEKIEWMQTAGKDIVFSLLDVLDDCERAEKEIVKNSNLQNKQLEEGVQLVFGKLKKILEQKGLQHIESIGKPFDTEFHEAITEIPTPEETQKGNVLDEVQKGYMLNGKIIRYAKVVVGK